MNKEMNTPVLLIVFNRPDFAGKLIDALRKVKPRKIYVAADGAREHVEGEKELCEETRRVATNIDWDCEVKTLFRDSNVGCGLGPTYAMDWLFENEEQGIILEDDCIPDPTFFDYCEELLERYKDDTRIMHIGGYTLQGKTKALQETYYFSRYPEVWGWATWRRAWKLFDFSMSTYPEFKEAGRISDVHDNLRLQNNWIKALDFTLAEKKPSIWDYRWMYCIWSNFGLCITPTQCLVKNIGFDGRGTHTNGNDEVAQIFTSVQIEPISKVIHPKLIVPSRDADRKTEHIRITPPWSKVIKRKIEAQVTKLLN